MRTRQRDITLGSKSGGGVSTSVTTTRCDGTVITSSATPSAYSVITDREQSRIVDSTGRGKVNAVRHRKASLHFSGEYPAYTYGINTTDASLKGKETLGDSNRWVLPKRDSTSAIFNSSWFNPPTASLDYLPGFAFISEANSSLLKNSVMANARSLKADVLLNIVEANQLVPAVKQLAMTIPNLKENWKQIRKVIKTASGGFLAWKFGISPLLSDIVNIHSYQSQMRSDFDRYRKGDSSRFSSKGAGVLEFTPTSWVSNGGYTSFQTYGHVLTQPTVRFVLIVKPRIQYQTELFAKLDFALRRFATSPFHLAWERIPFSFVADWFVDIRGVLDACDRSIGFTPYEVVAFSKSFKYHVLSQSDLTTRSSCSGTPVLASMLAGTAEYTHYERSSVSLKEVTLPSLAPRFGKSQALLTSALIGQMLTRSSKIRVDYL